MPGYELFGEEEKNAAIQLFDLNGGILFAHGFDNLRKGVYKVREFERSISAKVGCAHCQVVSSGSAALLVAIKALGVRKGDEVITQCFTFVATVEAIIEAGGVPVLTEVDSSLNMDPVDLEKKITDKTKLIIPVHMAGAPADMKRIMDIANKYNIPVLEDSAQCFGGSFKGKPTGTIGNAGIYSFDFAKNITTGEGGAIVTNQSEIYFNSRALHDHGHEYNSNFPRGKDTRSSPGFNYRMTEIQAAIGLAQIKKLDTIISKQRQNKNLIKEGLSDLGLDFRIIHDPDGDIGDTLIFFLHTKDLAEKFASKLYENSLGTKNLPDALQWHFAGTWNHLFVDFPQLQNCSTLWPVSRAFLERAIALPINVNMSESNIEHVVKTVRIISAKLM